MNVLLVRTSALGDVVHALPVLAALRRHRPEARIAWAVEETFAPLLEGHPDLAATIPVATRRWRRWRQPGGVARAMGEIRRARRALRAFGADVAIDLMGNHKGGWIARMSGARQVIGAPRAARREPASALWIGRTTPVGAAHAVDRMLELLAPLGIDAAEAGAEVDFGAARLLPSAVAAPRARAGDRPSVLIQAGAGWGNKRYPAAWWGEVAKRLRQRVEAEISVLVVPGEEGLAQAVVAAGDGAVTPVEAGPWPTLVALLRGCRLLLGGDTGPLHLAHALGTPVLCVMGPTDPARTGPYGAPERALWHPLPCSFCYKRFGETKACLLAIPPEAVADRAVVSLT